MLRKSPETGTGVGGGNQPDDAVYCRQCGHLITRRRWSVNLGGSFHRFTNPAGITFNVICFGDAPGAVSAGTPTVKHSWFDGYAWRFALCRNCKTHLGWCYEGNADPPRFYGFIRETLSGTKG